MRTSFTANAGAATVVNTAFAILSAHSTKEEWSVTKVRDGIAVEGPAGDVHRVTVMSDGDDTSRVEVVPSTSQWRAAGIRGGIVVNSVEKACQLSAEPPERLQAFLATLTRSGQSL